MQESLIHIKCGFIIIKRQRGTHAYKQKSPNKLCLSLLNDNGAHQQKSPVHIKSGFTDNEFVAFTCYLNLKINGLFCKILSRVPFRKHQTYLISTKFFLARTARSFNDLQVINMGSF